MFRLIVSLALIVISLFSVRSFASAQSDVKANKEKVQEFVKILNSHDLSKLDAILAPDFVEHNPFLPPGAPANAEAFKMVAGGLIAAFPDVSVTIEDEFGEGDKVVSRHSIKATHKGEFNGIPATNRAVTWTEIHIYRFKDGKIAEHWAEVNALGLIQQVSAPAPSATMAATKQP